MSKRVNMSEKWVTYPHGPLEKLADNLWVVDGELPHMPIGRKMTVIKKSTGALVLHSPIALDDAGMRNLEALGEIEVPLFRMVGTESISLGTRNAILPRLFMPPTVRFQRSKKSRSLREPTILFRGMLQSNSRHCEGSEKPRVSSR